jgi:beta-N-acetylhexosaminidase
MQQGGVAACGKHFPGHGDTVQDSHLKLPRLDHDRTRLNRVELVPFRAAAAAGIASMMTAHVVFDALDPGLPATMSRALLTDLLREEIGFQGVLFSDDVHMKAIMDHYGHREAAVRGAGAGVDNFLVCHAADTAHEMIDALVHAVERGELKRGTLEQAGRRLDALAGEFVRAVSGPSELQALASERHRALAGRIEARSQAAADRAVDPTEPAVLSDLPGAPHEREE